MTWFATGVQFWRAFLLLFIFLEWNISLIFKHYGLRSYFEVFEAKSPHQKTTYVAFLPKASCTMSSVGFVTQNSHFCSNFMASLFTKMLILWHFDSMPLKLEKVYKFIPLLAFWGSLFVACQPPLNANVKRNSRGQKLMRHARITLGLIF